MTHKAATVRAAGELARAGHSISEVARTLNVSRAAIRDWLGLDTQAIALRRVVKEGTVGAPCPTCPLAVDADRETYAYLLGLYLGDGCLSVTPKGVYRLRITCCDAYPHLMTECRAAIKTVVPANSVGAIRREGCTEIYSDSEHWICFFPQHGPGKKHERLIELVPWQQAIVEEHPRPFIRGLIHSDGCRVMNRVHVRGRWYAYPRYFFSNESDDIRMLFGDACDLIGVEWRHNRRNSISVARRLSVALLDEFVGPKS